MMRRPVHVALLLASVGLTARAQCPDGTPPPCRVRTASVATASPRRADPPLDANTWIVLPFDNLAKSPDVEWLRDASVNLLYLDLSKWQDIRVVDDERVADLLRATPEAQSGKQLSLAAGLALARHAGAGKLVMGDLIRLGAKTTVTAKVFDVKGGQRIRTTSQDATAQDSLMPAFGKLARGILNVVPPAGTNVGEIGTTNTGAYQEYLLGVKALNRFDLKLARAHLDTALKLDSTFALAHFKMATLIGWDNPNDPSKLEHVRAASRFSGDLPARERALVAGLMAFSNAEYGRACAIYGSLIKPDSADVEALYGMGECLYHDNVVERAKDDTTRFQFRGSWNTAIRVFRRTLVVDPTFHLAFSHILDAYTADTRVGCRLRDPAALSVQNAAASCAELYTSAVRGAGDSLWIAPIPNNAPAALETQRAEARRTSAAWHNLQRARGIAQEWLDDDPADSRAIATLARIDLMLGDVQKADGELTRIANADLGEFERQRIFQTHVEIDFKRGRDARLLREIDSAKAGTSPQLGGAIALMLVQTGRLAALDSLFAANIPLGGAPPIAVVYVKTALRVVVGLASDSAGAVESSVFNYASNPQQMRSGSVKFATAAIAPTLMFGLTLHRERWPQIDSTLDSRLAPAVALSRGDTAGLRVAAKRLDSTAAAAKDQVPDDGSVMIAADSYLILRDSAAALKTLRDFFDHRLNATPWGTPIASGNWAFASMLWPRALLIRAELEAAIGDKAVARRDFQRLLTLWAEADPEFKPLVDRARNGLAALPPG
jgi:TolB-like protein